MKEKDKRFHDTDNAEDTCAIYRPWFAKVCTALGDQDTDRHWKFIPNAGTGQDVRRRQGKPELHA